MAPLIGVVSPGDFTIHANIRLHIAHNFSYYYCTYHPVRNHTFVNFEAEFIIKEGVAFVKGVSCPKQFFFIFLSVRSRLCGAC
jgi:hypothetical protein